MKSGTDFASGFGEAVGSWNMSVLPRSKWLKDDWNMMKDMETWEKKEERAS